MLETMEAKPKMGLSLCRYSDGKFGVRVDITRIESYEEFYALKIKALMYKEHIEGEISYLEGRKIT